MTRIVFALVLLLAYAAGADTFYRSNLRMNGYEYPNTGTTNVTGQSKVDGTSKVVVEYTKTVGGVPYLPHSGGGTAYNPTVALGYLGDPDLVEYFVFGSYGASTINYGGVFHDRLMVQSSGTIFLVDDKPAGWTNSYGSGQIVWSDTEYWNAQPVGPSPMQYIQNNLTNWASGGWMKIQDVEADMDLVQSGGRWKIGYNSDGSLDLFVTDVDGEDSATSATGTVSRGEWNHYFINAETTNVVLYLDNVPVVTNTCWWTTNYPTSSPLNFNYGNAGLLVADWSFWSRSLSSGERAYVMNNGVDGTKGRNLNIIETFERAAGEYSHQEGSAPETWREAGTAAATLFNPGDTNNPAHGQGALFIDGTENAGNTLHSTIYQFRRINVYDSNYVRFNVMIDPSAPASSDVFFGLGRNLAGTWTEPEFGVRVRGDGQLTAELYDQATGDLLASEVMSETMTPGTYKEIELMTEPLGNDLGVNTQIKIGGSISSTALVTNEFFFYAASIDIVLTNGWVGYVDDIYVSDYGYATGLFPGRKNVLDKVQLEEPPPPPPPPANKLNEWTFTGDYANTGSSGDTATPVGAATITDNALDVTTAGAQMTWVNTTSETGYSLTMWIKSSTTGNQGLFDVAANDSSNNNHYPYSGSVYIKDFAAARQQIVPTGITLTDWNHIAITAEEPGGEWVMYFNGTPFRTTTAAAVYNWPATSRIGYSRTSYDFAGMFDDVILWDRALLESEIDDLVAAGRSE